MSAIKKGYFSYVRVSTLKQGQTGTSLIEQRAAIFRHAERQNLRIVREFEERETAAKTGRPVFLQMISALKRGEACGAIIHKIDRSARNLKDWAELGNLIDRGIEVHFANESLDLNSRGGRLSADIQAVVAADYIRNLREETRKGFYGRLKQGLSPMPACLGYLNCGAGNLKKPDPVKAPLIKKAFQLYASGEYGLNALVEKMNALGLRNRRGKEITVNGLSTMLHNPFYTGIIRLKTTGEFFAGKHQPIVSKKLFDVVQDRLEGKAVLRSNTHEFLFRQLLKCAFCRYSLIAERQKGHVYYRCHTRDCPVKSIREEAVNERLIGIFKTLRFSDAEMEEMRRVLRAKAEQSEIVQLSQINALKLQVEKTEDRLSLLTDGVIDGIFDRETYTFKKNRIIEERQSLIEKISRLERGELIFARWAEKILELANSAYSSYEKAIDEEKRELCQSIASNLSVKGKSLIVKLNYPFQLIADRQNFTYGSPYRVEPRTAPQLVESLAAHFTKDATSKNASLIDAESA